MTATSKSDLVARRLRAGEMDAALKLCRFEGIDAGVIRRELSAEPDYCWMGLYSQDGTLAALHRGMRWHRHLLLKGLFVAPGCRASNTGLTVAFAIREWARREGFDGILAWVEKNKPESHLAHRLRIRPRSPLLHRYLIPLPAQRAGARVETDAHPTAGTVAVPVPEDGPPAVKELLGIEQDDPRSTRIGWVLDRSRLVLSGNPCRSTAELNVLVNATESVAHMTGATSLEVPFEAADVHAALSLAAAGAKRLSRTPVTLGIASFTAGTSPPATARPSLTLDAENAAQ